MSLSLSLKRAKMEMRAVPASLLSRTPPSDGGEQKWGGARCGSTPMAGRETTSRRQQ